MRQVNWRAMYFLPSLLHYYSERQWTVARASQAKKSQEGKKMEQKEAISFALLVDWVEGRLPEDEAAQVSRALQDAGRATQTTVAWLRAFREMSEEIEVAAPPPVLRRELSELFQKEGQISREAQAALP